MKVNFYILGAVSLALVVLLVSGYYYLSSFDNDQESVKILDNSDNRENDIDLEVNSSLQVTVANYKKIGDKPVDSVIDKIWVIDSEDGSVVNKYINNDNEKISIWDIYYKKGNLFFLDIYDAEKLKYFNHNGDIINLNSIKIDNYFSPLLLVSEKYVYSNKLFLNSDESEIAYAQVYRTDFTEDTTETVAKIKFPNYLKSKEFQNSGFNLNFYKLVDNKKIYYTWEPSKGMNTRSYLGRLNILDLNTGESQLVGERFIKKHGQFLGYSGNYLLYHKDIDSLTLGTGDNVIRIANLNSNEEITFSLPKNVNSGHSVVFSPDNKLVAVDYFTIDKSKETWIGNSEIVVIDLETGKQIDKVRDDNFSYNIIGWNNSSEIVFSSYSGSKNGPLYKKELNNDNLIKLFNFSSPTSPFQCW
jgi:hypothetical protein